MKQVELAKILGISKVRMSQKVSAILKKCGKCMKWVKEWERHS